MELGTIQKAWVESLRENPEQQTFHRLGLKQDDGKELYCCLGKGLCVMKKITNEPIIYDNEGYLEDSGETGTLYFSYKKLGLKSGDGAIFPNGLFSGGRTYSSLSAANDNGVTWPEIADFIEANPEKVFTKSV